MFRKLKNDESRKNEKYGWTKSFGSVFLYLFQIVTVRQGKGETVVNNKVARNKNPTGSLERPWDEAYEYGFGFSIWIGGGRR